VIDADVAPAALARAEQQATAIQQTAAAGVKFDATDDMQMARMLVKSGAFGDVREVAQALAKIQAGREMGFTPVQSLASIHFIQGRLAMGSNLIASCVKRSRHNPRMNAYDYRIVEHNDQGCKIEFFELQKTVRRVTYPDGRVEETPTTDRVSLGISTFTQADGKRQSTKNMDKFPRNMLFARALTNGCRWYTPDVFGGQPVYTPDELGAEVDEVGRVRNVVSSREVGVVNLPGAPTITRADGPSLDGISAAVPAADPRAQVDTSLQPKRKPAPAASKS
jgi:hypothetical protein